MKYQKMPMQGGNGTTRLVCKQFHVTLTCYEMVLEKEIDDYTISSQYNKINKRTKNAQSSR